MEDKWQSNASLADTNLRMLEQEILCDVTFLAGKSKQAVRAHRYMLVSRSSVFYAMFCGPISEKTGEIEVPDIEANILKDLLRYMYSRISKINADTVTSLLYAANRYDVSGMMKECGKYLKSKITPENVCTILQHVVLYDDQAIIKDCLSLLAAHGKCVLKSEGFLSLTKQGLRRILELDRLSVSEQDVYASCVRWAQEQCRRNGQEGSDRECREALGDLLYLIRFPCMPQEYFASHVAHSEILSQEEKLDVYQQLCSSSAVGKLFSKSPRVTPIILERFSSVRNEDWGTAGANDAISFRCSKNAYLTGVGVYVPRNPASVNSGCVQVFKDNTLLNSMEANVSYKKDVHYEDIVLEPPQYIEKDVAYTVVQTFQSQMQRYGEGGKTRVQDLSCDLEITFINSIKTRSSTSTKWGQIPRLHIQTLAC